MSRKLEVRIVSTPLSNDSTKTELKRLHDLFRRQPRSFQQPLKILQAGPLGSAFTTSSVSRILDWVHQDDAICKMITKGMQQLCEEFGHGENTATMGVLVPQLVFSFSELSAPTCAKSNVLMHLGSLIHEYLMSPACACSVPLDLDNLAMLLALVDNALPDASLCQFGDAGGKLLCRNLLKIYLMCKGPGLSEATSQSALWCDTRQRIHILTFVDNPASSTVYGGLLVPSSGVVPAGVLHVDMVTSLSKWRARRAEQRHVNNSSVTVLTVRASLAADAQDFQSGLDLEVCEVVGGASALLESASVQHLLQWAREVVSLGVSLVLCQRCIHPALKEFFLDEGVLFVDRLGAECFSLACWLADSHAVDRIQMAVGSHSVGRLSSIEHVTVNDQGFWHLSGATSEATIGTLVLVSPTQMDLADLRDCCKCIWKMLDSCFSHTRVVYGGGCADWDIIQHLLSSAPKPTSSQLEELCCSHAQYVLCVRALLECLFHALLVSTPAEAWLAHCPLHTSHIFTIERDTAHGSQARCNCGSVARSVSSLSIVSSLSDVLGLRERCLRSGKADLSVRTDAALLMKSEHDAPEAVHVAPGIGPEVADSLKDPILTGIPIRNKSEISSPSASMFWGCLSAKLAMFRFSLDIAAAAVRIGTLVQEL